jgi:peptidoglycan/xylan/chitin deacetylase (PgdA/CDA1 family)
MLKNIKSFIYINLCKVVSFLANRRGVTILMYHRVNVIEGIPSALVISPKKFEEQMGFVKSFCDILRLEDLIDIYANKKLLPRRRRPQIIITFDDGYRDNYLNAYPILKKLKIPASIFLVTGFIGTDKKLSLYAHMPSPDMLNWQEVNLMQDQVFFCLHTDNHPHLPQLTYGQQKDEIKKCATTLKKNLSGGKGNEVFAYPYGQYNELTLDVLRGLDIKLALVTMGGINVGEENPLKLNRVEIDGSDKMTDFVKKISPPMTKIFNGWK